MTDWRKDHWRKHETEAEHAERVENAEREARWYWDQATAPQAATFRQKMADLAPYRGPFFERKRADALRVWREATKPAAELFERTAEAVMVTGEVSEALSQAWDELIAANVILQAAE